MIVYATMQIYMFFDNIKILHYNFKHMSKYSIKEYTYLNLEKKGEI
jgi:hypothetical protein